MAARGRGFGVSWCAHGADMVADFKKRLFCADTGIPRQEVDISDPLWQERISTYFDGARGFPPAGDPGEYATAFEAAYPEAPDGARTLRMRSRKGLRRSGTASWPRSSRAD